ncbi:MAG: PhoH family protein [Planctomycetaceae bacterium]|nr:PhoH family protein [Planctomycetaceae bacterium]MCP4465063.1 PhoH family protein [Planctomycetaceae bacterium]
MTEATISSIEPQLVLPLFGAKDQHLKRLRKRFEVDIVHRDGQIRIQGADEGVALATAALEKLTHIVRLRGNLTPELFDETIAVVTGEAPPVVRPSSIETMQVGFEINPRTDGQAAYVKAMRNHDIVFAIGPAGTGKTYLAVALAVEALKRQTVRKIILVRPAVEAGENLGFLPGDLHEKINPYLRPLLDAAYEMIGFDQIQRMVEQDVIEIAPLAYMRGRTLNEAFIILDEAQNTTTSQMKMFLTRMGEHSRIVVSGDPTQVDLPRQTESGLRDAMRRLRQIEGIKFTQLTAADIVRHPLVQKIVDAYDSDSDHF